RVFGVGAVDSEIAPLGRRQLGVQNEHPDWIVFADSPTGVVYAEGGDGRIHAIDTQSMASEEDSLELVASDLDDFFDRYVFGADSDQFCAGDWKDHFHRIGVW
ncbi:MAG TPA: hypothetical protein VMS40_11950, partial [Vicinamibacterales bacterium]|nr:hypothetical protein [Vicinamibacterales bacterium]